MKTILNTTCPVSANRINENAARIAAVYTILLVLVSVYTENNYLALLLAADFGMRAFAPAKYSPLRNLSVATVNLLRIKPVPVDAAPKKFAAGLGLFFCLGIALSQILMSGFWTNFIAGIIIFCAFLEAAFAFCLGCIVYTFLMRIFRPNQNHFPQLKE